MHEVRSHGLWPVLSGGLETPQSVPAQVESSKDVNATLNAWDDYIKKTARDVARSVGASGDDADEFAQAARIALWRAIEKGAPASDAYRKGIVKNAMRSTARKERGGFRSLSIWRHELDEELLRRQDDDETAAGVVEWADQLPANLRNIYELLYVEGFTQRDVARKLRVTQPRIAQLHAQLKRRAREGFLAAVLSITELPSGSGRAA